MLYISCDIESYSIVILVNGIKCDYGSLECGSDCTVYKVVIILFACCFTVLVITFVDAVSYGKNELCFVFCLFEVSNCCVESFCCCINFVLISFSLTENLLSCLKSVFVCGVFFSIMVRSMPRFYS